MHRTIKTNKATKKKKYERPELIDMKLDAPEATNYLAAIFVGTALAGCTPVKS